MPVGIADLSTPGVLTISSVSRFGCASSPLTLKHLLRRTRQSFWVFLGLAVAGLASGITLIALDGQGTCDRSGPGYCKERYKTKVPGIILTSAGGVSAGTSALLFYLEARKERAGSRQAFFLPQVISGGAAVTTVFTF